MEHSISSVSERPPKERWVQRDGVFAAPSWAVGTNSGVIRLHGRRKSASTAGCFPESYSTPHTSKHRATRLSIYHCIPAWRRRSLGKHLTLANDSKCEWW